MSSVSLIEEMSGGSLCPRSNNVNHISEMVNIFNRRLSYFRASVHIIKMKRGISQKSEVYSCLLPNISVDQ
jgi:hypothetical protein